MAGDYSIVYKKIPVEKFNIVALPGGFSNHVRWLLLLDSQFEFFIIRSKEKYDFCKGPNWPQDYEQYQQYLINGFIDIPTRIVDEMQDLMMVMDWSSRENKLQFIRTHVYPEHRTISNWINFEYRYRDTLDQIMQLSHEHKLLDDRSLKTIILYRDINQTKRFYDAVYSSYDQSITQGWSNTRMIKIADYHKLLVHPHIQHLSVEKLYTESLDKSLYHELISQFEFDNLYNDANFTQQLWFLATKRCDPEFNMLEDNDGKD